MRAPTVVSLAALLGTTLVPALAAAHIGLSAPTARAEAPDQGYVKNAPCGQTTDGRTSNVTVFQPGQVVTVQWVEYVNHPSYFRVAFQADGDSFPMRMDVPQSGSVPETAAQQQSAEQALFAGSTAQLLAVVQDNNSDTGAKLSTQVTLPNTTCENCTLQIVQVMYDNPPQTGRAYYQCADIAIRSGGDTSSDDGTGTMGSTDEQPPAGEPDAGTGSAQNGDVSATAAPGTGTSAAGSGTKSVGSGANGDGPSAAQPATTPASASAGAMSNAAETAMGVAAGTSASNPASSTASAPFGGSALTPEGSGGGAGGCSLGMRTSSGAGVSVAFLAGLAWVTRRRRAR